MEQSLLTDQVTKVRDCAQSPHVLAYREQERDVLISCGEIHNAVCCVAAHKLNCVDETERDF